MMTNSWELKPRQIKILPREYLLRLRVYEIESIWEHLPEKYKKDREIQLRRSCMEHWNRAEDFDQIDGPPPSKLNCLDCRREREQINEESISCLSHLLSKCRL